MDAARWRKASTREHCTALYPGSNPGRASSLRSLCELRLGKPATHLSERSERRLPRHSPKGGGGLSIHHSATRGAATREPAGKRVRRSSSKAKSVDGLITPASYPSIAAK